MLALGTVDIIVIVQDILIVLYKKKNSLLSYDLILLYQFITIFSSKLVFFKPLYSYFWGMLTRVSPKALIC